MYVCIKLLQFQIQCDEGIDLRDWSLQLGTHCHTYGEWKKVTWMIIGVIHVNFLPENVKDADQFSTHTDPDTGQGTGIFHI